MFWLEIMIQVIDNYRKRRFRKVIVKLLLPLQFICMCIEIFIFQICLEKALVRSSLQRGFARGYYCLTSLNSVVPLPIHKMLLLLYEEDTR